MAPVPPGMRLPSLNLVGYGQVLRLNLESIAGDTVDEKAEFLATEAKRMTKETF